MDKPAALSPEMIKALEQVEADAWEELCAAVPADIAQTLQLAVERRGNVVLSRCLVNDSPLVNRALALGMEQAISIPALRMLRDEFQSLGLKNFALPISPLLPPALAEADFARLGLVVRSRWLKLLRDDAPLAPPGASEVLVERVDDGDKLRFGTVSAQGFGRPPIIAHWMGATVGCPHWRHYLAMIDGQPAGAAAMYWREGYAWLGIGSTLPEFRQRGVQQQLIAARIRDGRALGVRHFISETDSLNVSCKNLQRAGFQVVYARPNYGVPEL